ncbi:hypothetical protein GJ744_002333 [Endocarpon pusillum]|uniref:EH domain-containing protein n=1 Tax=Endocarpon pusillum TaxID=364733 RepID=A0A8H7E9Y3_9EURO|nr:hypothetical protein GJ744_002333 [Endocarpon pusillum]
MNTNAESLNARDRLTSQSGLVNEHRQRLQSAAVRGASRAFTAGNDNQRPKALDSSTNGARAAAASAGLASRQKAVSPPKNLTLDSAVPPGSLSAQISQVQQLVQDFEQGSKSDKPQTPSAAARGTHGKIAKRSPSQVAARIASSHQPLLPTAPLALRNGSDGSNTSGDTNIPRPSHQVGESGFRFQSDSIDSAQPLNRNSTTSKPWPLQPMSSARPPLPPRNLEQIRGIVNDKTTEDSQPRQLPGISSTLAAQAAVRNSAPLTSSSVSDPTRKVPKGALTPEDDSSEDLGRGRSSTAHRQGVEGNVVPPRNVRHTIPSERGSTAGKHESSREGYGGKVSNAAVYGSTISAQPSHRFASVANTQYLDKRTSLTESTLADAIVASSLASSRAPSPATRAPAPVPAPPPPRRSSLSRALFRHRHSSDTDLPRLGAPYQGMRQTLRKYNSEDSDDGNDRRKHKHFIKHPNKHREGSRKRWKDKVTERERKRYEGVWAANKGLFLTTSSQPKEEIAVETSTSELVLDLVVRDIWSRSRLPMDTLAEIWDLVDRQGVGTLTRDEFVLGLWLIDQRLKGHKSPIRISPTLWASVRHVGGGKVPHKT